MGFSFESCKSNEVNEISDNQISSEQLSETEETAENFDDCSLYEVKDNSGNEVNSETMEDAEDDFEDCEAKMEEFEEENPELSEEDINFDDCGNETDGQYVTEVTFTTDGEVSDAETDEQLQGTSEEYEEKLSENIKKEEAISENVNEINDDNNFENHESIQEDDKNIDESEDVNEPQKETLEDNTEQKDIVEENEENTAEEIKENEEDTSETLEKTELSDEEVEEVIEEKSEEIEESVEEQSEEKEEALEDAEESASEEIDESVEENINSEEDLTEEEIKEQVEEDTSEALEKTELSDEDIEEVIEEKSEEIEETVKDEKDLKDIEEGTEETAENLEENEKQITELRKEKDLSDRIDSALDKEDSSYSELNDLAKENADAIESIEKERSNVETEMNDKFDEVLSKERGTDEYKDALQEYNTLKDQKAELDEKYLALSKQQDALERKSSELREAQITKGNDAISESVYSLTVAKALDEKFDSSYYEAKTDSKSLEQLSDENSAIISELSSEKDSIKLAMDAKMDGIAQYVSSNNMGRYETSIDPYYQKLNSEYLAMKSAYEKVDYSIVKLDENNRLISEVTGKEYHSALELKPKSQISEVNTGKDVPGETNYFIDETRANEVLSRFKQNKWENLSLDEQKAAITELANYNSDILGVEDKPRIVYYNKEDDGDFGGFSAQQNAIYINEYNMHDAAETADTISHEYRHKYQHERAKKLETERDLEFKEGFDNYIRAEDDYQGYKEQLVESDARAYAKVVQDKIYSTSEIAPTDAEQTVDAEGSTMTFTDLNPEKGAVFEKVSVDELPDDFEQKYKNNSIEIYSNKSFELNGKNRGEITYNQAVSKITETASSYMQALEVDKDVQEKVIKDLKKEIYHQQTFAEARAIGDHGIRHIYGNFERSENDIDSFIKSKEAIGISVDEKETAKTKLAILVSHVYHDHGYTDKDVHNRDASLGERTKEFNIATPESKFLQDKDHDMRSADYFVSEKQDLYKTVFDDDKTINSITTAIRVHNIPVEDNFIDGTRNNSLDDLSKISSDKIKNGKEEVEKLISPDSKDFDIIVSSVLISDKLALSEQEKFSEFLKSDAKFVELTDAMNTLNETIKQHPELGFYDGNGKLTVEGENLQNEFKNNIYEYIEREHKNDWPPEYKNAIIHAVKTDVGLNSGSFSSRMNFVDTEPNCIIRDENGNVSITFTKYESTDESHKLIQDGQIIKLYGDLGISKSDICKENSSKKIIDVDKKVNADKSLEKMGISINIVTDQIDANKHTEHFETREILQKNRTSAIMYNVNRLINEAAKSNHIDINENDIYKSRTLIKNAENYDSLSLEDKQKQIKTTITDFIKKVL